MTGHRRSLAHTPGHLSQPCQQFMQQALHRLAWMQPHRQPSKQQLPQQQLPRSPSSVRQWGALRKRLCLCSCRACPLL